MAREGHYASCTAAFNESCWCEVKHYAEMLVFSVIVLTIEIVAAYLSGSLALYADAWHVASDNLALVLNLITALMVRKRSSRRHVPRMTAFYAGLVLLVAVALWIIWEGVHRLNEPHQVIPWIMLVGAALCAGLLLWQIRQHGRVAGEHKDAAHGVQHKHFRKDFLINLSVIVGGGVIIATDWSYIDAILSIGIGVYILIDLAFGHRHDEEKEDHDHEHH